MVKLRWREKALLAIWCAALVAGLVVPLAMADDDGIGSATFQLSVGTIVPAGQFAAVGTIPGCTATLIDQQTVLTAAHCVCNDDGPNANLSACVGRTMFTLHDVVPAPDPATPWLIPNTRKDVSIAGTVYVHPDFGQASWLFYDLAIVKLDQPANERVVNVQPMPIELVVANTIGEPVTLVGYGRTGAGCADNGGEKRTLSLTITDCGPLGILLVDPVKYVCSGDSGSPLINAQGRIIGVASHGSSDGNSTYRPLYSSEDWISRFLEGRWAKIWGPVDDVVLGLNTMESLPLIYAVQAATGDLYAYGGVNWSKVGGPGRAFAVAGAGQLFGLTSDGAAVKRYQGSATGWADVGGAAGAIYGAVDTHPRGLYATNPISGDLMAYDGASWRKLSGPGKQFAFGRNGVVYRLDVGGGAVHRYDRATNQWTKIGGPAGAIYAAENVVYATNPTTGDLYAYDASPPSWTKIGGSARMFAVGDDEHLYGLAPDGSAVFQYLGLPDHWMKIGGAADAIHAVGDVLLAISPATHDLWRYFKQ